MALKYAKKGRAINSLRSGNVQKLKRAKAVMTTIILKRMRPLQKSDDTTLRFFKQ